MNSRLSEPLSAAAVFIVLFPAWAQPSPLSGGAHTKSTDEVLNFPSNISLGRLFKVTDAQEPPYATEKRYFAEARGDTPVASGSFVKLKLSFDGAAEPHGLTRVAPRAIYMLDCRSLDNLNDETLKAIGHLTNLHFLSLDETDTSDAGLAALAPLKRLNQLALKRTLLTGKSFDVFKNFPALQKLHLSFNQLKDASFTAVGGLKDLKELDVESCGIGDGALLPLGNLTKLVELNMSKNAKISDAGLVPLKRLSHLQILNVAETSVTASGLLQLKDLPLTKLSFNMKKCSQAELVRLQQNFPACKFTSGPQSNRSPELFAPLK